MNIKSLNKVTGRRLKPLEKRGKVVKSLDLLITFSITLVCNVIMGTAALRETLEI